MRRSDGTVALHMHLREMKLGGHGDEGPADRAGLGSAPLLLLHDDRGIWFCSSVPVTSADAPKLATGVRATAGNCR